MGLFAGDLTWLMGCLCG